MVRKGCAGKALGDGLTDCRGYIGGNGFRVLGVASGTGDTIATTPRTPTHVANSKHDAV